MKIMVSLNLSTDMLFTNMLPTDMTELYRRQSRLEPLQ
ncbi:hypothetical protein YPPY66_0378 [Yersinia pestis PY-66]|uniref:Uncharacterized protein n=2 Tax=Yersinia pestis TaxID=632 RepID=A0AAV3BI43_YERPE|nr:hypothetical protein YpAngola_A3708 [Yersinia pestis Angola]EDR34453.1 hypothetical protein YPIP275_4836 [Yersinia pestis biovar Orientalis str. IP275]EDR37437.1 hypothetical protein YpF1991016_4231 [Yersinia pestis biovar Orientalis str. F1991016]EDR42883.1 hypothetical protein YpE1979001_1134 [Yersinia pestis biovar Antiqua str. E1979001]EDR49982.1 hypothetical protein YpB42003004_3982 [Yersinia pestis biovar Antiqua str. B42003004]EDR59232.1 hypothetical protein YpMG051020_2476 [Yersinia